MDIITKDDVKFLHEQIKILANDVQLLRAYNFAILEILEKNNKESIKEKLKKIDSIHAYHQIQYIKDIDHLNQVIFLNKDENE